mgnify:CR=1 FL=1
METKTKLGKAILSYVVITLGILLYTFAWSAFMLPAKIVGGGVSGISSVLNIAVGIPLPIGVLNFIINAVLLAIGFKVLGSKFGANTIYGIVMSSLSFILWQQVLHVTLPNLRPMIVILLIMNVGKIFNADFGLFYNVPQNSGSLYPVTQVVDTYVYRAYANTHNLGMSSAAGFLQSAVGLLCITGANAIVRRIDADSSLF